MKREINRYLEIFPILTRIIKVKNLVFIVPETNVSGSPITGIQANNKDHCPYFLNHKVDLEICSLLNGNQLLLCSLMK